MCFENRLTSIEMNDMTIAIHVNQEAYQTGDTLKGILDFQVADADHTVKHIEIELIEKYENDDETSEFPYLENELHRYAIETPFTVEIGEHKAVPFHIDTEDLNFQTTDSDIMLKVYIYAGFTMDKEVEVQLPFDI